MAIPAWFLPALRTIGVSGVKYGPLVWTWLASNPDIAERIQREVQRLGRSSGQDPEAMRASLKAMREQVEYLRDSADDDAERDRAKAWSASLTRLGHAVEMLRGGSSRVDRQRLRKHIDTLRAEILDAFLIEQIEDAGGPAPLEPRDD